MRHEARADGRRPKAGSVRPSHLRRCRPVWARCARPTRPVGARNARLRRADCARFARPQSVGYRRRSAVLGGGLDTPHRAGCRLQSAVTIDSE